MTLSARGVSHELIDLLGFGGVPGPFTEATNRLQGSKSSEGSAESLPFGLPSQGLSIRKSPLTY